jgi:predicted ATPase
MTTRITKVDGRKKTTLKVEGALVLEDALLLAKVCADLRQQGEQEITIALDDLVFLDTSSAFVLSRLKHQAGISLEGACFFVHQVLELVEKQSETNLGSK